MFRSSVRRMWRGTVLVASCAVWLVFAGGVAAQSDQAAIAPGAIPAFTIREVMDAMVMPAADSLWSAVSVSVTREGAITTEPETDEDWAELRRSAISLAETANVLALPGRTVATPDPEEVVAEGDLSPAAIQAMLDKSWPAWVAHTRVLHAAALEAVRAIDARNVDGLTEIGGAIDAACESCHLQFWYPEQ